MKRLMLALLAVATIFTGMSAAEAQRWHGHRGYYGHRYYGHHYYGPRYYHRPYWRHRGYYRHGRRHWR